MAFVEIRAPYGVEELTIWDRRVDPQKIDLKKRFLLQSKAGVGFVSQKEDDPTMAQVTWRDMRDYDPRFDPDSRSFSYIWISDHKNSDTLVLDADEEKNLIFHAIMWISDDEWEEYLETKQLLTKIGL